MDVEERRLSDWEEGREAPSIAKLENLAETYHRSLATFLLPSPPREPSSLPDFRVLGERERASPFSEKTLLAIRRARRVQRVASDLTEEHNLSRLGGMQRLAGRLAPDAAAEKVAIDLGAYETEPPRFATPYQAMAHWRAWLEALGIIVLHFPMPVEDVRGFTLPDGTPPIIVVNQSDSPRARNFTMLHELGHLVRKTEGVCDLGGEGLDGRVPPIESWCNAFAGSFLVPRPSLLNELGSYTKGEVPPDEELKRLSSRYQVSETTILRRLLSTGVILQDQYREHARLRQGFREGGRRQDRAAAKRNMPVERVAEYGAPFISVVLKGTSEGRLALSDAADILDVRVRHLPGLSDRAAKVLTRA